MEGTAENDAVWLRDNLAELDTTVAELWRETGLPNGRRAAVYRAAKRTTPGFRFKDGTLQPILRRAFERIRARKFQDKPAFAASQIFILRVAYALNDPAVRGLSDYELGLLAAKIDEEWLTAVKEGRAPSVERVTIRCRDLIEGLLARDRPSEDR